MPDSQVVLPNFPPDALVGQNVAIHYLGSIYYRRVTFVEQIPWFQFLDIGAIALQIQSNRTQGTLLSQYDSEWGQFRWFPLDYAQVRFYLPQSQGKWTMRNIQVALDNSIILRNPDLSMTEFHVWESNTPWFEALNISDYAMTGCRLMAAGHRFVSRDIAKIKDGATIVREIESGKEPCKHVWASGASSVAEER